MNGKIVSLIYGLRPVPVSIHSLSLGSPAETKGNENLNLNRSIHRDSPKEQHPPCSTSPPATPFKRVFAFHGSSDGSIRKAPERNPRDSPPVISL